MTKKNHRPSVELETVGFFFAGSEAETFTTFRWNNPSTIDLALIVFGVS